MSGCAQCRNPAPTAFWPAAPIREPPIRKARLEYGGDSSRARGGSYTVCVRTCDGSFFPVTYSGRLTRADGLEEVCRSLCPNTEVELYSFPLGGTIDEAVSATGEPYADLPNADKFEQTYDPRCSCRGPGQSWAKALAAAEARYGHNARDILVTPEKSAQMSRPVEDRKAKLAGARVAKSEAAATENLAGPSALDLDVNGVDTRLSAAAATMSRETSGIRDESAQSRAIFQLDQGRTVEEQDPDGAMRRVRIVGPAF